MLMATKKSVPTKQGKRQNCSGLKKCFQAIVDRKQVSLDLHVLRLMLKFELQVELDKLNPNLAEVLPYMTIVYIRNWPGWQKSKDYYSGKLNYREWFIKFRQYIIVRLNYLIKNGYQNAVECVRKEKLEVESIHNHKGTQTVYLPPKETAPFSILVTCPAKLLCTLVFCGNDNDIILSHHTKPSWTEMTTTQLMNWPHVGIEFSSAELSFKRYNRSEYRRYVNFTSCSLNVENHELIEEINILNPNTTRSSYTLNRLYCYARQYLDVLQKFDNLDQTKLDLVEIVLEEFLKDVQEIGVNNTMATNTSVLFNIGQCVFVRNKKLNKRKSGHSYTGRPLEVGFCETFVPKMEMQLNVFHTVQDVTTPDVTFQHLNILEKMIENKNELYKSHYPKIHFKCLFCKVSYDSHEELINHFEKLHGMEPNFICVKCLKSLTISSLARIRWKHVCIETS